jgi:superfamily I DNA/RNA helicase
VIRVVQNAQKEMETVSAWIGERLREGYQLHEIGVFVRAGAQMERARNAVRLAKADYIELGEDAASAAGKVAISTMHLAKGLEFRGVAVMACDDGVLPLEERIEAVSDESDLEEVYNTERHLLYVACTRARDCLLITGVAPASEFLADLTVSTAEPAAGHEARGMASARNAAGRAP